MGNDGHYYFVDTPEIAGLEDKKYSSGAEVFNRNQGVLTHTQCNHSEVLGGGMLGQQPLKKSAMKNISFKRPQSAQVNTNNSKNKSKIMKTAKGSNQKESMEKLARPQTSQQKNR